MDYTHAQKEPSTYCQAPFDVDILTLQLHLPPKTRSYSLLLEQNYLKNHLHFKSI